MDGRKRAREEESEDGGIVKASVVERNGEISCSVEETNRIRALLGLRPLNMSKPKEVEAVENFRLKREEEQRKKEEAAVLERLEKAKDRRLLHSKLVGASLGDVSSDQEEGALLSAADWVRRSRTKELTDKEKAKQAAEAAAKRLQEQEEEAQAEAAARATRGTAYSAADLRGLHIMHDANAFETGAEVILTLADSSVLDKDERGRAVGINSTDDVLENVNLADADRLKERETQKKRSKQPAYVAYDDAEFAEGVAPGKKPSILSQYDETVKSKPKLRIGNGFAMQIDGVGEGQGGVGDVGVEGTRNASRKALPESLRVDVKEVDAYYSKEEYAVFNKPKNKTKKKRRVRDDKDNEDEGLGAASLEAALMESGAVAAAGQDRGVRKAHSDTPALPEDERRRQAYESAVRKAGENTERVFGGVAGGPSSSSSSSSSSFSSSSGHLVKSVAMMEEDDDADIALSLSRARRLALAQQRAVTKASSGGVPAAEDGGGSDAEQDTKSSIFDHRDSGAAWTARLVSRIKEKEKSRLGGCEGNIHMGSDVAKNESKEGELWVHSTSHPQWELEAVDAEGRRADGTLVFSSSTEFTTRLQARLNERARSRAEAAVRAQERAHVQAQQAKRVAGGILDSSSMDVESSGIGSSRAKEGAASSSSSSSSSSLAAAGAAAARNDEDDAMAGGNYEDDDDDSFADQLEEDDNDGDGDGDEQMGFLHRQPLVGQGMAATLVLLQGTGDLRAKDELAGRAKDRRLQDPSARDFDVKLEYRDEFGRKLTTKEAYRQLNYKFHGFGPSKKKQEKRLREMEQKNKAMSTVGAVDSGTMASFTRAQEAMGHAHITLQMGGSGGAGSGLGGPNSKKLTAEIANEVLEKQKIKEQQKAKSKGTKHG